MNHRGLLQGLVLTLLTAFFSAATIVLGAVPMLAHRQRFGRWQFLVSMLAVVGVSLATGYAPIALTVLILATMVFIFAELDDKKIGTFKSGFFAVFTASSVAWLAIQVWLMKTNASMAEVVRKPVEQFVSQLKTNKGAESSLMVEDLIAQVPSGMIIGLVIAMALAVLFESRMAFIFQFVLKRNRKPDFVRFKVPNPVIWVMLTSLVAAFYYGPWPDTVRYVGSNVLNVLLVAYFFQGLAVVTVFFNTYKVTPFWRTIWYIFIVLQLFLFVSCLGFLDFWLDFRTRLKKKVKTTTELKDKGGWT